MISPLLTRIVAWRKWIYLGAAVWTIALFFVARGTAHLRSHTHPPAQSQTGPSEDESARQLSALKQENIRLQSELKKLPELTAAAAELREQLAPQQNKNNALWTAQSNALQTAIEQQKRDLAEVHRWSSNWHTAKQRAWAASRLAEKASALAADPEKEYAQTKETLHHLALAEKRLAEVRHEWVQLAKSEKDQFRPRLEQAQAEWSAAYQKLGEDRALYQTFPLTNTQNPSTVVFLRSIVPDQNGTSITVYLDGTVQFSK